MWRNLSNQWIVNRQRSKSRLRSVLWNLGLISVFYDYDHYFVPERDPILSAASRHLKLPTKGETSSLNHEVHCTLISALSDLNTSNHREILLVLQDMFLSCYGWSVSHSEPIAWWHGLSLSDCGKKKVNFLNMDCVTRLTFSQTGSSSSCTSSFSWCTKAYTVLDCESQKCSSFSFSPSSGSTFYAPRGSCRPISARPLLSCLSQANRGNED
jgi:hypothetical protein